MQAVESALENERFSALVRCPAPKAEAKAEAKGSTQLIERSARSTRHHRAT